MLRLMYGPPLGHPGHPRVRKQKPIPARRENHPSFRRLLKKVIQVKINYNYTRSGDDIIRQGVSSSVFLISYKQF